MEKLTKIVLGVWLGIATLGGGLIGKPLYEGVREVKIARKDENIKQINNISKWLWDNQNYESRHIKELESITNCITDKIHGRFGREEMPDVESDQRSLEKWLINYRSSLKGEELLKKAEYLLERVRDLNLKYKYEGVIKKSTGIPDGLVYGGLVGLILGSIAACFALQKNTEVYSDDYEFSSRTAGEHYLGVG